MSPRHTARLGRPGPARVASVAALLLVGLAGCHPHRSTGATTGGAEGGRLVLGTAGPVESLDPAFAGDPQSLRAVAQVFEPLLSTRPGTTEPAPGLATAWSPTPDGRAWTLDLRPGVRFSDGEPLDAAAVCANVARWDRLVAARASRALTAVWAEVDGAARARPMTCVGLTPQQVRLVLPVASGALPQALAVPTLGLVAPARLATAGAARLPAERLSGTGPFRLGAPAVDPAGTVRLLRAAAYWGEPAHLDTLVLRPMPRVEDRYAALVAGTIGGYDGAQAADVLRLEPAGATVLQRPAFDLAFLGIDQRVAPLDRPEVRQAVARALDRQAAVTAAYPSGTAVAREFTPPLLPGYADDVAGYGHDPTRARAELVAALARGPVTARPAAVTSSAPGQPVAGMPPLLLAYPSSGQPPALPDPQTLAESLVADLRLAGFAVSARAVPAAGYARALASGRYGLWLGQRRGLLGDAEDFLGGLFAPPAAAFGLRSPELTALLDTARATVDPAARARAYERANRLAMRLLPGVPLLHTRTSVILARGVRGYVPSPTGVESFATVALR